MVGYHYVICRKLVLIQQVKEVRRDRTGDWIGGPSKPFDANSKTRKKVNVVGDRGIGLPQKDDLNRSICPDCNVADKSLRRLKR